MKFLTRAYTKITSLLGIFSLGLADPAHDQYATDNRHEPALSLKRSTSQPEQFEESTQIVELEGPTVPTTQDQEHQPKVVEVTSENASEKRTGATDGEHAERRRKIRSEPVQLEVANACGHHDRSHRDSTRDSREASQARASQSQELRPRGKTKKERKGEPKISIERPR